MLRSRMRASNEISSVGWVSFWPINPFSTSMTAAFARRRHPRVALRYRPAGLPLREVYVSLGPLIAPFPLPLRRPNQSGAQHLPSRFDAINLRFPKFPPEDEVKRVCKRSRVSAGGWSRYRVSSSFRRKLSNSALAHSSDLGHW
jgi:hypothetical protein